MLGRAFPLRDATETAICRKLMLSVMASMSDGEFDVYDTSDLPIDWNSKA